MSGWYEITRNLASWKRTQSTSYLVCGSQRLNSQKTSLFSLKVYNNYENKGIRQVSVLSNNETQWVLKVLFMPILFGINFKRIEYIFKQKLYFFLKYLKKFFKNFFHLSNFLVPRPSVQLYFQPLNSVTIVILFFKQKQKKKRITKNINIYTHTHAHTHTLNLNALQLS